MPDKKPFDETIVLLSQRGGALPAFPAIEQVARYWNEMRGARLVPRRSEIDPRRMERALNCAFVLERLAPGVARFRLAGMHLNELMGMEVRGMPLTALFPPDGRRALGPVLAQVFDDPAVATLDLAGDRGIGKPPLDARMVLLPLESDLGEISRILGCLASVGPVGRTPRRFEVRDVRMQPLSSGDTGREADTDWAPTPETVAGSLAEPPREFRPRPPRPGSGRPHLYVVKNDD